MKKKRMNILVFLQTHWKALLVGLVLLGIVVWVALSGLPTQGPTPTTFFECSKIYKVSEGTPRTCKIPLGKEFVEYQGNQATHATSIRVTNLPPAPVVSASPFVVYGFADEGWYKDDAFAVELVSGAGRTVGKAQAQAQRMPIHPGAEASNPVPFSVSIEFSAQKRGEQGALVLHKSGSDDALVIPVFF